jgi:hypothetical protein
MDSKWAGQSNGNGCRNDKLADKMIAETRERERTTKMDDVENENGRTRPEVGV